MLGNGGARVLVITQPYDPTAELVLSRLNARGVPFLRFDPGDFPGVARLSARHDPSGWHGTLAGPHHDISLRGIRAVYYRRPSPFRFAPNMTEPERDWAASQARHAFTGVLAALPNVLWVNDPARNADARPKPYQLAVASSCGLRTPPTLITNDPADVALFAAQMGGRIITKAFEDVNVIEGGRTGVLWTQEVPAHLFDDPSIGATAHLFQRSIPRQFEVRMTLVGNELFASAIHVDTDPDTGDPAVDVRANRAASRYEPVAVPDDVAAGVRAMLNGLGLVFGAFDFIVDPDGRWWFIELNPNGQWAWIPFLVDPIAGAITDLLQTGYEALDVTRRGSRSTVTAAKGPA